MVGSGQSLIDIEATDYFLLLELFTEANQPKEDDKQDALSFFGTFLSPEDMARAKGEI